MCYVIRMDQFLPRFDARLVFLCEFLTQSLCRDLVARGSQGLSQRTAHHFFRLHMEVGKLRVQLAHDERTIIGIVINQKNGQTVDRHLAPRLPATRETCGSRRPLPRAACQVSALHRASH